MTRKGYSTSLFDSEMNSCLVSHAENIEMPTMPDTIGRSAQHRNFDSMKTTAISNAFIAINTNPATPLSIVSDWLSELAQSELKRWNAIIKRLNGLQKTEDKSKPSIKTKSNNSEFNKEKRYDIDSRNP